MGDDFFFEGKAPVIRADGKHKNIPPCAKSPRSGGLV
jgi:hypothetical protein